MGEVSSFLQGSSILLYGPVKIGKTETASTFPKPLFIAGEKGHKYIDPDIPVISILSVKSYSEIRRKVLGVIKKHKPKTVVVDTIGSIYNIIFRYICKEEKVVHPSKKGDYGRAIWQIIREELRSFIEKILQACDDLDATLIFVSHSKAVRRETSSLAYEQITYDLPYQVNYILPQFVDHIWLLDHKFDEDNSRDRVLYLKGDIYIDVDTRDKNIKTSRILLTKKNKPVNAFKRISFIFNRDHDNNGE